MPVGMPSGMPAGELPGEGPPGEVAHVGADREPRSGPTDRAEFLGEDVAGREYWLLGGRVYADGDGRTYAVCPLGGWGRLRKVRAARGSTRGYARRRALAA
jgi:hypothetical protein